MQCGAAEAFLAALARLDAALASSGLDAAPILAVHDEVILDAAEGDAPAAAALLEECMLAGALDLFPAMPTERLVEARIAEGWTKCDQDTRPEPESDWLARTRRPPAGRVLEGRRPVGGRPLRRLLPPRAPRRPRPPRPAARLARGRRAAPRRKAEREPWAPRQVPVSGRPGPPRKGRPR